MVNGEVRGTALNHLTLYRAAGNRAAAGLLAERHACCYRLDFKQLVYLFGLQWRVPETETWSPTRHGGRNGFRGFPQTSQWLWPDDRAHPVSPSRSSLAAAVLCLAELRLVPGIP